MNFLKKQIGDNFFLLTYIVLTAKSYIVSRFVFNLDIENVMQELILFLASAGSIMFILSLVAVGKKETLKWRLLVTNILGTFILYFNVVYYRFFNDFITLPVLFQTDNASDLGESIVSLMNPLDILLITDFALILYLFKYVKPVKSKSKHFKLAIASVVILLFNIGLANIERPQILTRSFDRQMLVKNLGVFNYHLYDGFLQAKTNMNRALADNSELAEVLNYTESVKRSVNEDMTGVAKGKNVFVISLESTQNFVINNKVDGKVITPFLNQLTRQEDTYYFNNFYHQTGQGKTSDSEFLFENSLYGLPRGAAFFTHAQNEYNGLPSMLKEKGYTTSVFHANNKSFWNRDVMYENLGYDNYFSESYYEVNNENSIGWGLKDQSFYEQSIPYLKDLSQPFYSKFITLTNHFPFTLEQEDELIPEWTSNDGTVNRYFTTVRYEDEALKQFFERLKEEGLYKNSIFIIMGDHYGISQNHNEAMGQYLGKEVTPFVQTQLQRVPMIVHIPGETNGRTIPNVSGQIDVKPTILNMLGIEEREDIQFGSDLFTKDPDQFVVLRDGGFITDKYVYTDQKCYDKSTEKLTDQKACEPYIKQAEDELKYSDQVVYGDLLRFLEEKEQGE
ncbi:LTA synthase family protein [Rossellomorea aquimaris]|uniref:Phosphoglycerol transferase MdoB-like AlkP superfamily enzyme n=1 Tax=Rossellomorea aquimaris TaxID=189382 RepID=A0A366ET35_9BACI|nr:LTA synthase family protein [Rossellomorea aquimaris]RBP05557.1 phosphoglycerol transferase MdoB-like AlkP superfamily enzyme [Rossellomorea aquimaris]